jgi:hypothetical protein
VIAFKALLAFGDAPELRARATGASPGLVIASSAMTNADTRPPTVVIVLANPDVKLPAVSVKQPAVLMQFTTRTANRTA